MDTSGAKIWLPGISDPATLEAASRLCGTTAMREVRSGVGRRHDHHDFYTRHPVMTPEMIRQLPGRYALVLRGGMSPVIARLPTAWHDHTYKAARRDGEATATLSQIREPGMLPDIIVPLPGEDWPGWDTRPDAPPGDPGPDGPRRYPWQ